MKKLLAVLAVVGIFALVPAAAFGGSSHPYVGKPFCVAGTNYTSAGIVDELALTLAADHGGGYWALPLKTWLFPFGVPYIDQTPTKEQIAAHGLVFVTITKGACAVRPKAPEPARIAYCSVAGNTWPDGTPIPPGTFLNLLAGQTSTDAHYTGATPAFWVEGVGLTCSLNPSQAALAAASTVKVGGGGTVLAPEAGGIYTFIPAG